MASKKPYIIVRQDLHTDRKSDKEFKENPTCYRCGGPHLAPSCRFKETICRFCKKRGHVEKVCRSKANPKQPLSAPKRNFYVQEEQTLQLEDAEAYGMYTLNSSTRKPIILDVYLNDIPIKMELDRGASLSIISSTTYNAITQQSTSSSLEKSATFLKTYRGESIKVLGTTSVNARYGNQKEVLTVHVVAWDGPDLMGRDWLPHFNIISLCEVNHVTKPLQDMLDKHSDVFHKDLGCMKGVEVTLDVPQTITTTHDGLTGDVMQLMDHLSTTTISSPHLQKWTNRDPTLSKVKAFVLQGFPSDKLEVDFTPYQSRARELSVINGCILWGARVVVPPQGREAVLKELHDTHPGCSKMKALARCYIWWPKMDSAIEDVVKHCQVCQQSRPSPPVAPLHP